MSGTRSRQDLVAKAKAVRDPTLRRGDLRAILVNVMVAVVLDCKRRHFGHRRVAAAEGSRRTRRADEVLRSKPLHQRRDQRVIDPYIVWTGPLLFKTQR